MLTGRVAFVTGAASGIGRAACAALASQGAKVIAADLNVKAVESTLATIQDAGQYLQPVELDVRSRASVERALAACREHYGAPPSVVVNSAGVTRDNFLLAMSEAEFDEVLGVNLRGTFLVTKCAAQAMIDAAGNDDSKDRPSFVDGASIVNIASIIGKTGNIGQSNYAASKAGVEAFTKSAAAEFGKFGIRVNAVLPGFIKTPMTDKVPDKVKQMFINRIPLKRMGEAKEVAEVILFLASNKSSYINGASIEVTGGLV